MREIDVDVRGKSKAGEDGNISSWISSRYCWGVTLGYTSGAVRSKVSVGPRKVVVVVWGGGQGDTEDGLPLL